MYKKSFFSFLLLAFLVVLYFPSNTSASEPTISVKLINYIGNKTELRFSNIGEYTVKEDPSIILNNTQNNYLVKVENGNLVLYNGNQKLKDFGKNSFTIATQNYGTHARVTIHGNSARTYLGEIRFQIEDAKFVRPVNVSIPFEDYLKGVVPHEMPASWNVEALKAQAIAARTYAIRGGHIGKEITDTQTHQVYGGYEWYNNSNIAVEQTSGQVLRYNGSLISAVYSSSNGGITESNVGAWGGTALPYLPVKTDNYDPINPWSFEINKVQIDMRGKDLKRPQDWWGAVSERDGTVANSIKSWINRNYYPNSEIKIITIPEITISSDRTSGGRSRFGSIKVQFYMKDSSNNYVMQDNQIKLFTVEKNMTVSELRSVLNSTLFKSNLLTSFESRNNDRLAGKDRFEVAVNISQKGWGSGANTVILANYNAFADALAAAPLAYKYNGPILLTQSNKLTEATKREITRLNPSNVIIVGGEASVSNSVRNELGSMNIANIWRLGGKDRFEVAYYISRELGNTDTAIVANGLNFPDALAIAPYAARNGFPILLTGSNNLPEATRKALSEKNITKTTIVGGEASVGKTVANQLPKPYRIGGKDRFEVAANIIPYLGLNPDKLYIATGMTFADALTGSVLAAKENGNLLLTLSDRLPAPTQNAINNSKVNNFVILGGTGSVSDRAISSLPNSSFSIAGKGYGHGVGMSQYGAKSMADRGLSYQQILNFYYPGTTITNY